MISNCFPYLTERVNDHANHWIKFHDSINPVSKQSSKSKSHGPTSIPKSTMKPVASELESVPNQQKVSAGIDKNATLANYQDSCIEKGIIGLVTTATKGETSLLPSYPSHFRLIADCKMKPSSNLYYRVRDLRLDNVIIFLVKSYELYFTESELVNLKCTNKMYHEMIDDVLRLRSVDFSVLKLPRLNYVDQVVISQERVDLATACAIHYGLHTGMVIRYLKGEYVGESRDAERILAAVSPHISEADCNHIRRIINQGCPSYLDFEEDYDNKHSVLCKGNQQTFLEHPEVTAKAMNKEEKNSHVLPFKHWVVHFSPYCRATPQGIREKYGKYRVIFDSSTQTSPDEIVLNQVTLTDHEATIDFGTAKTKLLTNIYNWRVSFPDEVIYLALADITACFRFPRLSADVAGAFGFLAEGLYFASTSHVFGSNTSASSWEPFRRGIQNLITILSQRNDLFEKHKELLAALQWTEEYTVHNCPVLVKAFPCEINRGVLDSIGKIIPMTANIYVDDILAAAAIRDNMIRLLAAIIEAIFLVCGTPDVAVRQCPLSLEKWFELVVGPRQIILGLVVDTNTMTVGITDEYIEQVRELLKLWDPDRRFFKVNDMQKLVGKLARLGEGAPWIFKLMSHLYTSLAFALKTNTELLRASSSGFQDLVNQITTKNFLGKQSEHQRHIKFAMKKAAKMITRHKHNYLVNQTMRDELNFLSSALSPESGIKFETPIAHLIPRIPTASIIGDSSLVACGGYSLTLGFWWHLSFPKEVVERTLLHLKDNSDRTFILINCLEYVTIILNYCASRVTFATRKVNDDPYPVVLCVTDNTSALNWTLHTSKKSTIGRALARFFCGLLIGSNVGVNAKWISTIENVIADKISRLKALINTNQTPSSSNPTYDYANLQQEHKELRACVFFQPSHKLLSLIWETLLTQKCPDLDQILKLRPQDLGRLFT